MKILNNILFVSFILIIALASVYAEEGVLPGVDAGDGEPVPIAENPVEEKDDYLLFCESVQDMIGDEEIVLPGFVPVRNELVQIYDNSEKPILNLKVEDKVLKSVNCGLDEDYTYTGNFDLDTLVSLRDADNKVQRLKEILETENADVRGVGPVNSVKAFLFKIGLKIFG